MGENVRERKTFRIKITLTNGHEVYNTRNLVETQKADENKGIT